MTARVAVRIVTVLLAVAFVAGFALSVQAHDDGGVDEPFQAPQMNQASYWEARFGADCTKYENHSGSIPDWVDIAVVHDGQFVRVYNPAPGFVLGPHNPNNGKHFGGPHSWVMKCTVTTTTTAPTTTTTEAESTTTVEPTTTTAPVTTSSTITTTTTDPGTDTTPPTSAPLVTTPPTSSGGRELPFTGAATGLLSVIAAGFIVVGLGLIARREP